MIKYFTMELSAVDAGGRNLVSSLDANLLLVIYYSPPAAPTFFFFFFLCITVNPRPLLLFSHPNPQSPTPNP